MSMTREARKEVEDLLRSGQKNRAVQYLNNTFNISLQDATILVEALERELGMATSETVQPGIPSNPTPNASGCLRGVAKAIGWFFAAVAVMFLVAIVLIYYFQSISINNSDLVTGTVTDLQYQEDGKSAPIVEYELRGTKRSGTSSNYSSPPDYHVGQTVPVYVNRQDPDSMIIDTFTDRYALLVGLGIFAVISTAIAIVFLYFGRRKF